VDISKLTIKELQSLLERVEEEIAKRKQREKSQLVESIAEIASEHGYSLRELIGPAARPVKGKRGRKRKPFAVKYRHPKQANLTWTGRGRRPHWINEWLDEGKTMEALAV
jgi:DNA-binding protein H-NS